MVGIQLICILINFLTLTANAKRIPRWWMRIAQKQGPNACVVEEIPGADLEIWTECKFWLKRKICGQNTRIRFECCEGFDHLRNDNGCTLVKPLQNVLDTAEALGATKWVNYVKEAGLDSELETGGHVTLFAPTNAAFDTMKASLKYRVEGYRRRSFNPIINYHILPSKMKSNDLNGDHTEETRLRGHSIRVNKYSNGMTTVNCALVTRKDVEATNGIVHVIDGVLDPENGAPNDIVGIIKEDGRFEIMAEMLERSGYMDTLRSISNSMTIFLPSDEAFQKLSNSRREKMMQDSRIALAISRNHVIPHVICQSAITGEHKVRTDLDTKLTLDCTVDGKTVEESRMTNSFVLGKNGVLNIINEVLQPDKAKTLVELAESRGLFTFAELIRNSGLERILSETGDYTFFAPQEEAWYEISPDVLRKARQNSEFSAQILRFHGIYEKLLTSNMENKQEIPSLNEENTLRLQVFRKDISVEDAKIIESDIEAYNGVLHVIDKVILPPILTLWEALDSYSDYQTFGNFQDMLSRSQYEDLLNLNSDKKGHYTFFVPTDRALEDLNQSELTETTSYPEGQMNLIMGHVVPSLISESVLEPGLTYTFKGFGKEFNIRKKKDGVLEVNGVTILDSQMTKNGILYIIEKVLEPSHRNSYKYQTLKGIRGNSNRNIPLPHKIYPTANEVDSNNDEKISFNEKHGTGFNTHLQGRVFLESAREPSTHVLHGNKSNIVKRVEASLFANKFNNLHPLYLFNIPKESSALLNVTDFLNKTKRSFKKLDQTVYILEGRNLPSERNNLSNQAQIYINVADSKINDSSKWASEDKGVSNSYQNRGTESNNRIKYSPYNEGKTNKISTKSPLNVKSKYKGSYFDSRDNISKNEINKYQHIPRFFMYNAWNAFYLCKVCENNTVKELHDSEKTSLVKKKIFHISSKTNNDNYRHEFLMRNCSNDTSMPSNDFNQPALHVLQPLNENEPTKYQNLSGEQNFSYVGHYYGNDVVGHTDDIIPYTLPSYRRSDLLQSSARPVDIRSYDRRTTLNRRVSKKLSRIQTIKKNATRRYSNLSLKNKFISNFGSNSSDFRYKWKENTTTRNNLNALSEKCGFAERTKSFSLEPKISTAKRKIPFALKPNGNKPFMHHRRRPNRRRRHYHHRNLKKKSIKLLQKVT